MIQTGFNHNIRYKSVLFHVQTEDYGIQKHQVVTQLFYGGTIVCKTQMDYAEFSDLDDVGDQVLELMKVQHIKMLKDLVNGKIEIPAWIFNDKKVVVQESSKPTFDLDKKPKEETIAETIENSIAEFLVENKE